MRSLANDTHYSLFLSPIELLMENFWRYFFAEIGTNEKERTENRTNTVMLVFKSALSRFARFWGSAYMPTFSDAYIFRCLHNSNSPIFK